MTVHDEEMELLRDIRERLLEAGIDGTPYIHSEKKWIGIHVHTFYRDAVHFARRTDEPERSGGDDGR
jgi:hypothetical protein